jgi:hypothetical protein
MYSFLGTLKAIVSSEREAMFTAAVVAKFSFQSNFCRKNKSLDRVVDTSDRFRLVSV